MKSRFRARSTEAFDLLAAIGRDCVGAVQLLPADEGPAGWNTVQAEPMDETAVERTLAAVTADTPWGQRDDEELRLSIAGAQEKTALLRIGRRWHRPRGATPTTHILKLPLGLVGNMRADMTSSVENEWLCSRILRAVGLRVADTEMAQFGSTRALVVTRFDRRWVGIPEGADTKARFRPPADAWIALQHRRGGRYGLTPLYDVLSAWPIIGDGANRIPYQRAKLAMGVKATDLHFRLQDIQPRHWHRLATTAAPVAWPRMLAMAEGLGAALEAVEEELPAHFPRALWQAVGAGVRRHAALFLKGAMMAQRAGQAQTT